MLDIFRSFFDTLFPPHESIRVITPVRTIDFLRAYTPFSTNHYTALSVYNHHLVKAAITANKFHNSTHAAKLLGSFIARYHTTLTAQSVLYVPIPLSGARLKSRGYNQVQRILETVPTITIKHVLVRTRDTLPQTSLQRTDRLRNMSEAFVVSPDTPLFSHTTVVIVDDVVTTGATLQAAKAALATHCDKSCTIICLALAH